MDKIWILDIALADRRLFSFVVCTSNLVSGIIIHYQSPAFQIQSQMAYHRLLPFPEWSAQGSLSSGKAANQLLGYPTANDAANVLANSA